MLTGQHHVAEGIRNVLSGLTAGCEPGYCGIESTQYGHLYTAAQRVASDVLKLGQAVQPSTGPPASSAHYYSTVIEKLHLHFTQLHPRLAAGGWPYARWVLLWDRCPI